MLAHPPHIVDTPRSGVKQLHWLRSTHPGTRALSPMIILNDGRGFINVGRACVLFQVGWSLGFEAAALLSELCVSYYGVAGYAGVLRGSKRHFAARSFE